MMLSPDEIANRSRVFDDVQKTLQQRWKGAEVIPYGSFATGVALKNSDADSFVKIPNYNSTADVIEAKKLFQKQPDLYSTVLISPLNDYSLITIYHNPTDMYCDMLFGSMLGLQSSRLVGYFIKLDERIATLVVILKLWSRIHQVTSDHNLSNFGLYSLLIFYLQQKDMGPPVFKLQNNTESSVFDEWDLSFSEIPYNSTNTENVYQLLGGFFKYYSEFNFEDYIVSISAGRPIFRSEFADINKVPDEFSSYKTYMRKKDAVPLGIKTDLCIQIAFKLNVNSEDGLTHEKALKFLSHIKFAARMFKELPSDRFLRSILIKDQHNETYARKKIITVDQISKLSDCINGTIS